VLQELLESMPILARALTAPVEPFEYNLYGLMVEGAQALGIAKHSVVVAMASVFSIEEAEKALETEASVLPAPVGEA
jgi:hypothetical protein